jgi:hypothetical protein
MVQTKLLWQVLVQMTWLVQVQMLWLVLLLQEVLVQMT